MTHRRGATLLEIIIVMAIIGVLSALAGYTVTSATEMGRINGQAQVLANVLRNARNRAIVERCAYVVQLNGLQYSSAPVSRASNSILVWRKNNCASTTLAYEPGLPLPQQDRLVESYNLDDFKSEFVLPPGWVSEPNNRLTVASVSIGWQANGTRMVWVDDNADGTSADTGIIAGDLGITVRRFQGGGPTRAVTIPTAGPAVAP